MELKCKWCGETKPEDLMVRRNATKPFIQSNIRCCRQCSSLYQRRRYQIEPIRTQQLKANASWRKAHPDQMAKYAQKHVDSYPAQTRARNRVHHNLRMGYWS